jgi:hypothetical protein
MRERNHDDVVRALEKLGARVFRTTGKSMGLERAFPNLWCRIQTGRMPIVAQQHALQALGFSEADFLAALTVAA